jgi:cytochrome oxidase Cu insertion factor (SCO1/SenC/PrrC family)
MRAETVPRLSGTVTRRASGFGPATRLVRYFASDSRRAFQTALGLIWLLDGGLQFQAYMYSHQFPASLANLASGQPGWLSSSVTWGSHVLGGHLVVFNTLFALTQVALGLGLLCRRTVKPAILASVAWALVVWWFGEGFGMLFTGTANMLTGAPGAVILYAVIGLAVWPSDRPGGLLGVRGVRLSWAAVWLIGAWLWLMPANSGADATYETIMMTPAGMTTPAPMHWLSRLEGSTSVAAQGHGLAIALVLAVVSVLIAVPVALNRRPTPFIVLGIAVSLAYWVLGQSFGGMFYTPSATDPNSGPLLVLFGLVVYSLTPVGARAHDGSVERAVRHGRAWLGGRRAALGPRPAMLFAAVATTWIVAVAVAALIDGPTKPPVQPTAPATPFQGQAISPPAIAPPIVLHDDRGRPVSLSQFAAANKAVLLTFLTSHCANGCPLVAQLRRTLSAMPAAERARLQVVAVSADPQHDTAASVAAFLARQHMAGQLEFLIGSAAQLQPIWSAWNLADVQAGISSLYGITASGEAVTTYSSFFSTAELVHDVKRLEAL